MNRLHAVLAITAATLGWGATAADLRAPVRSPELAAEIEKEIDHISAIDLAERIMRQEPGLQVFDLRSSEEYADFHIPGARHALIGDLLHEPLAAGTTIVLYSEGATHAAQAWVLMRLRGHRNVFFLREGIYEWLSRVQEPRLAVDATPAEREEFRQTEELSRFFGGVPLSDVPRNQVPLGYWNEKEGRKHESGGTREVIANIRRRGC